MEAGQGELGPFLLHAVAAWNGVHAQTPFNENVSGSVAKSIFSPPLTGHSSAQVYTGVNKTMHVSTHCIVDLSNGQNIKAMIQHMGATSTDRLDVKVHTLNMTITPLN